MTADERRRQVLPAGEAPLESRGSWLWNHIGRISGIFLGLLAFGGLVFLAVIGWPPAIALVVVIVAGFAILVLGGKLNPR